MPQNATKSDLEDQSIRPCGLLRRLTAMTYDGLLLIGLWMIAAAAVVIPLGAEISASSTLFQLYLLVIAWAYFAISWRGGQTLGMKAWHIRVVGEREPMPWLTTLVRFVVALASLGSLGLGFAWSLFHRQGRTWHDLASATHLVVVKPPGKNRKNKTKAKR